MLLSVNHVHGVEANEPKECNRQTTVKQDTDLTEQRILEEEESKTGFLDFKSKEDRLSENERIKFCRFLNQNNKK